MLPDDLTWTLVLVAFLVLMAWHLSFTATRLDRLHARMEGARNALDAQLVRRSSVALQLATSGLLDPATSLLLAGAAADAREAADVDREVAESDLTQALHAAFADPGLVRALNGDPTGSEIVRELASACQRVELARRFYNEAVRAARVVRRKRAVRYLRLAGHAPWPATFEMDDTSPLLGRETTPAGTVDQ
jgi:uncharacterized protein (DUF1800 family)